MIKELINQYPLFFFFNLAVFTALFFYLIDIVVSV